jgi:hypothetical protein
MQSIAGYNFETSFYLYGTNFNEAAGIYIIYTADTGTILDVGETNQLKSRLSNHERKLSWLLNSGPEEILVAFHHEKNQFLRLLKEKIIREKLNPICGLK